MWILPPGMSRVTARALLALLIGLAACTPPEPAAPRVAPSPEVTALRAICDTLVARQLPNGTFAEKMAPWWEASIAVRTLTAAYQILGDARYLRAVERTLDRFVAEQEYDGSWSAFALESVPTIQPGSFNLADVGSMTACLSIVIPFVSPDRAQRYLAAHRRYIDRFATLHDLGGRAFSNGWYLGEEGSVPYTVATATQAVSFTALHQRLHDPAYLRRAERAAGFLMKDWGADGRPVLRSHNEKRGQHGEVTDFHNVYYILEALLWVHVNSGDEVLREQIAGVLRSYLDAPRGLLRVSANQTWWRTPDERAKPKMRGMLGILCACREIVGPVSRLAEFIEAGRSAVCPAAGDTTLTMIDFAFAGLSLAHYVAPETNVFGRERGPAEVNASAAGGSASRRTD